MGLNGPGLDGKRQAYRVERNRAEEGRGRMGKSRDGTKWNRAWREWGRVVRGKTKRRGVRWDVKSKGGDGATRYNREVERVEEDCEEVGLGKGEAGHGRIRAGRKGVELDEKGRRWGRVKEAE